MNIKFISINLLCWGLFMSATTQAQQPQCVATQSCQALGYTSSGCSSGKGIKCPFGSGWYCPCDNTHVYSCTGDKESAGSSKCGNKYSSCNCASGYHWSGSFCKSDRPSCRIGDIYLANGDCTSSAMYAEMSGISKGIGIVVYVNPNGIGGQAISPKPIDSSYYWSDTPFYNNPHSTKYSSVLSAKNDFKSCVNTDTTILDLRTVKQAAIMALTYSPDEAPNTKWCLPAAGVLNSLFLNRTAINSSISNLGGKTFANGDQLWSSSEQSMDYAWSLSYTVLSSTVTENIKPLRKDSIIQVRPVIEF